MPEAVIVAFLALPFFRPFVKKLMPLDGLFWLPSISLLILLGIFPAYGFRPECLPMLIVALSINIVNFALRPYDSIHSHSPLLNMFLLVFLSAAAIPMFVFAPKPYSHFNGDTETARTLKIENSDKDYYLQIYGTIQTEADVAKPLIFLVPPELGSARSVELVCRELNNKGFTVVTYSRKGYDTPYTNEKGQTRPASPFALLRRWRIFRKATDWYSVNEQGKNLETERRSDIEFLLLHLPAFLGFSRRSDLPPLLLTGYGAGGSALAYMAGETGFASRYGKVLGVVAIESRLWSSYLGQDRQIPEIPPSAGIIQRQLSLFTSHLGNMGPRRVLRTGPLPGNGIPVMYLISGKALESPRSQKPYEAIFDTMHTSNSRVAALAAVERAGLLDYQDFPFTHPLYSFFLTGQKGIKKSENPIGNTAALIGNFAVFLLEQAGYTGITIPPRQDIDGGLYIESRGLPGFRL